MIKRVALSMILAAGLSALPAALNNGPVALTTAVDRTDDPIPCPDCTSGPDRSIQIAAFNRTDDPIPCPDCTSGPDRSIQIAIDGRTDDPIPCPDCTSGPDRSI